MVRGGGDGNESPLEQPMNPTLGVLGQLLAEDLLGVGPSVAHYGRLLPFSLHQELPRGPEGR